MATAATLLHIRVISLAAIVQEVGTASIIGRSFAKIGGRAAAKRATSAPATRTHLAIADVSSTRT